MLQLRRIVAVAVAALVTVGTVPAADLWTRELWVNRVRRSVSPRFRSRAKPEKTKTGHEKSPGDWRQGRGRLAGWPADWLAVWLAGWLLGWYVGCMVGFMAGWLVGWLVGMLPGWLFHCLASWLIVWLVG